jgi:hypothetical protein
MKTWGDILTGGVTFLPIISSKRKEKRHGYGEKEQRHGDR